MRTQPVEHVNRRVHTWLEEHVDDMTADLTEMVSRESPSTDDDLKRDFVTWLVTWLCERIAGVSEPIVQPTEENAYTVVVRVGETATPSETVVALCHYDTVWEGGTIDQRPARVFDGRMTGPGVFDMKSGIVQLVWAIRAAQQLDIPLPPLVLLFNGDEEIGSNGSRLAIEATCDGAMAALVFEPSRHGDLKTARKGTGFFDIVLTGIPGHPGLDPDKGANAIRAAAECVTFLYSLEDREAGTQISVGVLQGGTRRNVIAETAVLEVDVRISRNSEAARLEGALRNWTPADKRVTVSVESDWSRPVMERTAGTAALFERARALGAELGLELAETAVGGASDGNFAAALGVPVLDGLGAIGDGAHATDEWISVRDMPVRASLAAALIASLRRPLDAADGRCG